MTSKYPIKTVYFELAQHFLRNVYKFLRRSSGCLSYYEEVKKKASLQRRGLVTALAISALGTQCLFAYQPENNIWSQRRKAIRCQSPTFVASLPVGSQWLRSEPLISHFPTPQSLGSAISKSLSKTVPKGFIKDHAKLLAALSSSYGTVRKVSLGDYIQCVLSVAPKGSATPDVVNFIEALKMERALDFK